MLGIACAQARLARLASMAPQPVLDYGRRDYGSELRDARGFGRAGSHPGRRARALRAPWSGSKPRAI
jgi:hypothetical protein